MTENMSCLLDVDTSGHSWSRQSQSQPQVQTRLLTAGAVDVGLQLGLGILGVGSLAMFAQAPLFGDGHEGT